jgi:hypothetical protein
MAVNTKKSASFRESLSDCKPQMLYSCSRPPMTDGPRERERESGVMGRVESREEQFKVQQDELVDRKTATTKNLVVEIAYRLCEEMVGRRSKSLGWKGNTGGSREIQQEGTEIEGRGDMQRTKRGGCRLSRR